MITFTTSIAKHCTFLLILFAFQTYSDTLPEVTLVINPLLNRLDSNYHSGIIFPSYCLVVGKDTLSVDKFGNSPPPFLNKIQSSSEGYNLFASFRKACSGFFFTGIAISIFGVFISSDGSSLYTLPKGQDINTPILAIGMSISLCSIPIRLLSDVWLRKAIIDYNKHRITKKTYIYQPMNLT
jgi:hypothetical protein